MRILNGDAAATFNGKVHKLYSLTGKVMDTNTRSETEVHGGGGGGGGFSYQGTGASSSAPVRITSTTTRYTKVFLIDGEGREHAIELVDFDIRCRAGNGLTLVWAIPEGKSEGPYIAAYNHATREMEYNLPRIAKLCQPTLIAVAAGGGGALALGLLLRFGVFALFLCALGIWLGGVIARRIGRQRAQAFAQSPQMATIRGRFEAIPTAKFAELSAA